MTLPPFKVVGDDEAEQADFVICLRAGSRSPFKDNLTGVCAHCGAAIIFRPYMPKTPQKICLECANDLVSASGKPVQ